MKWKSFVASVVLGTSLVSGGSLVHAEKGTDVQKVSVETPKFVKKNLKASKVLSEQSVKKFLKDNESTLKVNPYSHLSFVKKETDDLGMTHFIFQPVVQNVPIANSKVVVHTDKSGKVTSVNGELHQDAPQKIKQKKNVKKKESLQLAWDYIGVDRAKADKKQKSLEGETFNTLSENTDLVVYDDNGDYKLAYHVELQFAEPYPANWQVYVNAESGKIIKANNLVEEATGTGTGVLGDTKSLNTYYSGGTYYLYDITKPMNGVIETFDNKHNGSYNLPGTYVTDTGDTFYSENQKAAVDAHYYAGKVYDFYYNNFGRNSYDDQGSSIRSTVHYGSNYNNAAWTGNQMIYGDGDGYTFTYLSGGKDIVGHELTHAVTESTAGLVYESQSGALNESFSDVFGYFMDPEDWLMGEDVYTPGTPGDGLRSLSNPNQYGQPDSMDEYQNLPVNQQNDWGGVHTNSGIPNKAAYYTISSLGLQKSEQIYYRALTVYLTPNSDFSYARQALVQSATDLYGTSEANAVAQAWDNVGVY
uniref:Neutral metalloproteinase n=1 Tax=Halobacillus sp. SCSIO 20089 TaxID=1151003 RepID=K0EFJ2_9BACI|nr:HSPA [Halobacillus sp. SCSIO 20089]